MVLRRRKSRSDQTATVLSAVAVARSGVCGCGLDCQARVTVGEERVARCVRVGGRGGGGGSAVVVVVVVMLGRKRWRGRWRGDEDGKMGGMYLDLGLGKKACRLQDEGEGFVGSGRDFGPF